MGGSDNEKRGIEAERHLFDRIVKYTGVFGGVQGVTMLVTLVINKVKSTLLGTAGYGITESLNRNIDLIRNSTNLGISTVAVPEISHCSDDTCPQELSDKIILTRSWASGGFPTQKAQYPNFRVPFARVFHGSLACGGCHCSDRR